MRSALAIVTVREIREKLRSRAFLIVNAVLLLLVLAGAVLPGLLRDDTVTPFAVATVGDASAAVLERATAQGEVFGLPVEVVTAEDEATGRALLLDEEVDAVLLDGDRLVARDDLAGDRIELLDSARRVARLDGALAAGGVAEQDRAAALAVPPLDLEIVDATGEERDTPSGAALAIGLGTTFSLYGLLIFYGQQVAQGIVQEKQSRVIEVLLATVRPIDLLGGKLLGLGLLGLGQITALLLVAGVGIQLTGTFDVPSEGYGSLAVTLPWFVLGYSLYATMFAIAAAVVPKIEDLQTAMTVPILLLVGSFFLAQFAITDPGGTLATVGALVPFSAPIVHPLLAALGRSSWPLALGGLASAGTTIAVLVPLAARIHAGAALSTRTRLGLRDALRRARA
jgi:ABC-2 type transport system permease protein